MPNAADHEPDRLGPPGHPSSAGGAGTDPVPQQVISSANPTGSGAEGLGQRGVGHHADPHAQQEHEPGDGHPAHHAFAPQEGQDPRHDPRVLSLVGRRVLRGSDPCTVSVITSDTRNESAFSANTHDAPTPASSSASEHRTDRDPGVHADRDQAVRPAQLALVLDQVGDRGTRRRRRTAARRSPSRRRARSACPWRRRTPSRGRTRRDRLGHDHHRPPVEAVAEQHPRAGRGCPPRRR